MKKSLIWFISGMIVSVPLTTFAEDGIETVQALLREDLTIFKDGAQVQLDNPPLSYQDVTYLPLREVAKVANMSIEWNPQIRAITIETDKPPINTETGDGGLNRNGDGISDNGNAGNGITQTSTSEEIQNDTVYVEGYRLNLLANELDKDYSTGVRNGQHALISDDNIYELDMSDIVYDFDQNLLLNYEVALLIFTESELSSIPKYSFDKLTNTTIPIN